MILLKDKVIFKKAALIHKNSLFHYTTKLGNLLFYNFIGSRGSFSINFHNIDSGL